MKTLIIYAHPNHESLCYAFLQKVLEGCRDNLVISEIQLLDLYAEGFDPVLVFNEKKRRRDMHTDPKLARYREQLSWAEQIVLIYPIWWGRPPAMLLGYIDQMFAAGFAYQTGRGLFSTGLLKGKRVVCISTMKGPTFYPLFLLNNAHKVLMRRALFSYIGIRKVKFFEFGSMENPAGRQEQKLNRIYQYFRNTRYEM